MAYFDAPYRPADLTLNSDPVNNSCVGFWPLTDGSGSTAVDVSTGGNDGTQSGGVSWASSEIGTVASFDGVDDRFEVDDAGDFDFGTGDFSVSAWVYFDTTPANSFHFVSRGDTALGSACWFSLIQTSGNKFNFAVDDNVMKREAIGATTVVSGTWYHVVGVRNSSGTNVLYVNGDSDGSVADNGNSISQSASAYRKLRISSVINSGIYNRHHDGNIQNVRIFDSALTAAQVKQLYTRPWTGTNYDTEALWLSPPASPVLSTASEATSLMADIEGWWPMTDGSGTTLTDISGNGRDATLYGTNIWVSDSLGTANRFDNSSSDGNNARTADTQPDLSSGYTVAFWIKHEELLAGTGRYGGGLALTDGAGTGTWWQTISSDIEIYFNSFSSYTQQHPLVKHNRANGGTSSTYNRTDSTKAAQNNVWHFWVVTFDGTNARVYQDASLVGTSGTLAAPLSTTGKHIVINGPADAATGLTCSMQNVRLYSRCLSADEINTLYERPWIGAEYNETAPLYPPVPSSLTPLDSSNSILVDQELWLPLTDGSGTAAVDISGGSNDGTLDTTVSFGNGELGTNAEFDPAGLNDGITTTYSPNGLSAISLSAWVRNDGGSAGSGFAKILASDHSAGSGGFDWMIGKSSNTSYALYIAGVSNVSIASTTLPALGEWWHAAATWETGGNIKLYINGVEVTYSRQDSYTGSLTTTNDVEIGDAPDRARPWDGGIQNVRVWSRALSATEVADIYYSPWLGSAYPSTGGGTPSYFVAAQFNRLGIGPRFRRL